jgi:hypothetical protein
MTKAHGEEGDSSPPRVPGVFRVWGEGEDGVAI